MNTARTTLVFAATAALVALPTAASAADYSGAMTALNDSGASASTWIGVDGTEVTVRISGSGFAPNLPHAQHLHGSMDGMDAVCPTPADVEELDADGDGLLSTPEAASLYGGVMVALTTAGDTSADSALAVDRFPVADADGDLEYERTFTVSEDVAAGLQNLHVVVHGVDVDGSGAYDGDAPSPLDESLPLEATLPAACGALDVAAAMPAGGVDTGSATGDTGAAMAFGAAAIAATGAATALIVRGRRGAPARR